jgi:putative alpha-1,2-mannosidase
MKSLEAEIPGWDFEAIRNTAKRAWESELARLTIEPPNTEDRKTFYSAMYHALPRRRFMMSTGDIAVWICACRRW